MNNRDLFLRIKAVANALDKLIESDTTGKLSEDINTLSLMLVELINEFDKEAA